MRLNPKTLGAMIAHAELAAPVEACGYLVGKGDRVARHMPMTNTDKSRTHFTFDPQEQFAAQKAARKEGYAITGVYHSHPESPARPSAEDVRLANDPALVYVIISLMSRPAPVKGFHIRDGVVAEELLVIEEESN